MANQEQINSEITRINEKWTNANARNGLFGNILKSVTVQKVRGLSVDIEFSWPVTAIAGTNGSGKTTLLQLCSAAYIGQQGGRIYKIGDWVRAALGEETPAFNEQSSVSFSFWNDGPTIAIPYQKGRTRWGYPRHSNPIRNVDFLELRPLHQELNAKIDCMFFARSWKLKTQPNSHPNYS